MVQRTEAVIKSQTENSMKPKSRHQGGLFLAMLTVAPRHGLQMAQERKQNIHNTAGFPRGMINYLLQTNFMLPSLWEIQPVLVRHFTGMYWQN